MVRAGYQAAVATASAQREAQQKLASEASLQLKLEGALKVIAETRRLEAIEMADDAQDVLAVPERRRSRLSRGSFDETGLFEELPELDEEARRQALELSVAQKLAEDPDFISALAERLGISPLQVSTVAGNLLEQETLKQLRLTHARALSGDGPTSALMDLEVKGQGRSRAIAEKGSEAVSGRTLLAWFRFCPLPFGNHRKCQDAPFFIVF